MKFDLHTHHFRCGHADGNIRDYIEAAIAADLQVIGISDHTPYFGSPEEQPFPAISMAKADLAGYVEEVLALKKEYEGKIKVLLGIESLSADRLAAIRFCMDSPNSLSWVSFT